MAISLQRLTIYLYSAHRAVIFANCDSTAFLLLLTRVNTILNFYGSVTNNNYVIIFTARCTLVQSAVLRSRVQGCRHGVNWGGHVHPTFARGHSWDWRKSGVFSGGGEGSVMVWSCTHPHPSLPYTLSSKWPSWNLQYC